MPRQKTEAKRQAVLRASAVVIAKKGFHGATVADIAAHIGLGLGTFYRYFDTKTDAFRAVVDEVLGEVTRVVATETPGESTTLDAYRQQVERICRKLFQAFIDNREFAQLLYVEAPAVDRELNELLRASVLLFGQLTEGYLENGVKRGFLRHDLDVQITALALNGIIFEGVRHIAVSDTPDRLMERWQRAAVDLIFKGMAA